MKKTLKLFAVFAALALFSLGQKKPEVGGGHIPTHGPPPTKAAPAPRSRARESVKRLDETPHPRNGVP